MKKFWPWLIGIGIFVILAIVVWFGLGFLRYSHSPVTMMGDRMRAFGDYDSYRFYRDNVSSTSWAFPVFSIFGMVLMVGLPLAILALVVAGVVMLVRASKKPETPQAITEQPVCPSCAKEIQNDWKVCPHCGENLKD